MQKDKENEQMLTPELRERVGRAVYAVWCRHNGRAGDFLPWEYIDKASREQDMEQGEAAIAAYLTGLPVPLEGGNHGRD